MNSWAPLFSKIVDSSIWVEPDHVCKVFITMLALKDADQVVRYTAFALAQRAHKTEAEVLDALRVLSEPDTKRLEPQPHEGRRIQKVADGWLLLNGQFYSDMMRNLNRREYKARKQREYRRKAGQPLIGEALALRGERADSPLMVADAHDAVQAHDEEMAANAARNAAPVKDFPPARATQSEALSSAASESAGVYSLPADAGAPAAVHSDDNQPL